MGLRPPFLQCRFLYVRLKSALRVAKDSSVARAPHLLSLFSPISNRRGRLRASVQLDWFPAFGISAVDALPRFLQPLAQFTDDTLETTRQKLIDLHNHVQVHSYWRSLCLIPSALGNRDYDYDNSSNMVHQGTQLRFSNKDHASLLDIVDALGRTDTPKEGLNKLYGPIVEKYAQQLRTTAPTNSSAERVVRQRTQVEDSGNNTSAPQRQGPSQWQTQQWHSGWHSGWSAEPASGSNWSPGQSSSSWQW